MPAKEPSFAGVYFFEKPLGGTTFSRRPVLRITSLFGHSQVWQERLEICRRDLVKDFVRQRPRGGVFAGLIGRLRAD